MKINVIGMVIQWGMTFTDNNINMFGSTCFSEELIMFYSNTIEQLFLFVEHLDQLELCLPYRKNKTSLTFDILAFYPKERHFIPVI